MSIIKYLFLILVLAMNNSSLASKQTSNLVIPVSYFVDHVKQLNDLKTNLNKYRQASIVGTSGIGKTQLARTYAYENRDQYNLIWFFDCNLDINQEFVKLAKQLNQVNNAKLAEDPKLVQKEVISYLSSKDKWLLVFDNLKIGENKKVIELVEWEHNGHVIFASQDKEKLPYITELAYFNQSDCIILANNILKNASPDKADFLATSSNGYPILIVQTAQLLNQLKGLDLETYKKQSLQAEDKIRLNIELVIKELKPSAVNLLYQLALINNQSFSRDFLSYITNNKESLNEDIYQISKFALISIIENGEHTSLFEMHDVIVKTIISIMGDKKTKILLNSIIDNLVLATPETIVEFHVFRSGKTVFENFKVIADHTEKYNIDLLKSMKIKSYLMIQYNNYSDYYGAEKLVSWFKKNDEAEKFKLLLMNNDEKARYADFLGSMARYYRNRYSDFNKSMQYNIKAKTVFEQVKGYKDIKADVYYQLALSELKLGNLNSVEQYVVELEGTPFVNNVQAMFFYLKGEYKKSLEKLNNAIKIRLNKIKHNDLVLTSNYLMRAQVLNSLERHQEAFSEAEQLYNMHKSTKKDDHLIFGRIFTQLAKSELGLKKIDEAFNHIAKAISIFLADEIRNPKTNDISEDPDLAGSYVVQGDVLSIKNDLKQALESYRAAQKIYFYLYKNNSGNIAQISELYLKGAKAACKLKDLYHYKSFGLPQVREFGKEHFNTITMFEYCKQHDMDLWAK